jgi:uncharacterized membrane protein
VVAYYLLILSPFLYFAPYGFQLLIVASVVQAVALVVYVIAKEVWNRKVKLAGSA